MAQGLLQCTGRRLELVQDRPLARAVTPHREEEFPLAETFPLQLGGSVSNTPGRVVALGGQWPAQRRLRADMSHAWAAGCTGEATVGDHSNRIRQPHPHQDSRWE